MRRRNEANPAGQRAGGASRTARGLSRTSFRAGKILSKKISIPRRPGRPRTNLEAKILGEMSASEKKAEEIVAKAINSNTPSIMSFEAAQLLLAIEGGVHHLAIESTPIFQKINQFARQNGPRGKWPSARDFLEEFLGTHASGWNWREEARQGNIEERIRKQEDYRFAQEHAEDARWNMAWATKYYTPDAPDCVLLHLLAWENRKQRRFIRNTWPTLRELKLATAIPERMLKKIIESLRPKNGEIIKEPFRHKFSRGGAVPLRYGPRLIVGVLSEFLNRMPEFPIDDGERKQLRKTALIAKRAFAARLGHSRRAT